MTTKIPFFRSNFNFCTAVQIGFLLLAVPFQAQSKTTKKRPKPVVPSVAMTNTKVGNKNSWPAIPEPLKVPYPVGLPLNLEFTKLIPTPWPTDPLEELSSEPSLKGTLVYLPFQGQIFEFRGVNLQREIAGKLSASAQYYTKFYAGNAPSYDPQFSPDGQRLLFKVGSADDVNGLSQIYVWNFTTRRMKLLVLNSASDVNDVLSPDGLSFFVTPVGKIAEGLNKTLTVKSNKVTPEGSCFYWYDIATGKERAGIPSVIPGDVVWTQRNTILYGALTQPVNSATVGSPTAQYFSSLPFIGEAQPSGGTPVTLIKNGFSASPSPDGRWIAFFGWPEDVPLPADAKYDSSSSDPRRPKNWPDPALYVFDRKTKRRILVSTQPKGALRWTPDGKTLVALEAKTLNRYGREDGGSGGGTEAHIRVITLAEISKGNATTVKTMKELAVLKAKDYKPIYRGALVPSPVRIMQITKDAKYLLVDQSEFVDETSGYYTEEKTLRSVNLSSGVVATVARVKNASGMVTGWDWHDESTLPQANLKVKNPLATTQK